MQQQPIEHLGFRLAPLTRADESLFIALFSCAEVMQQIGPVLTEAEALALLEKVLAAGRQGYLYWVVWNPQGQQVGLAALTPQSQRSAEFGLMLLPSWRQRGYSVPVSAGVFKHAFTQRKIELLKIRHKASNYAVPKFLSRLFAQCYRKTEDFWFWRLDRAHWLQFSGQYPYGPEEGIR